MRRKSMVMCGLWILLAVGCTSGQEADETTVSGADGSETRAPADQTPATAPETAAAGPVATANGADYSEKWLIILSSKKELGHVPDAVGQLAKSDVETSLERLQSSEFKGLMPCYEIVVAQSFTDKSAAIGFSQELTALGVDNYPKNAGKWVGSQPRIEAYCAGEREPDTATSACPSDVRFVETYDGGVYAHLALDEVLAQKALEGAPKLTMLGSRATWSADLPHKVIGTYKVGDDFEVWQSGQPRVCTILNFVSLVRGTPHWGYMSEPNPKAPGCGSPEVFATLECSTFGLALAAPAGKLKFASYKDLDPSDPALLAATKVLRATPSYRAMSAQALSDAKAMGGQLAYKTVGTKFTLGGKEYIGVNTHWLTNDGFDMCGGEDINQRAYAVVGVDGTVHIDVVDAYELAEARLIDISGDGTLELMLKGWTDTRIVGADGAEQCAISVDYCDCAC